MKEDNEKVWVVLGHDFNRNIFRGVFKNEVDARRYAMENYLEVKEINYGEFRE